MFFRSERLFLRPGWPEDWAELLALIDDEAIVRNLARAPWPYSPHDAREFASQPQAGRYPHFFITLPGAHGARMVGCVGIAEHAGEVELGYWIARQHRNKGYATEASRAVLSLARTLGHRKVTAGHFLDNPASARVLVKSGLRPTGEVRPRFSLACGDAVPGVIYAVDLGDAGNCDNCGESSDSAEGMRAA